MRRWRVVLGVGVMAAVCAMPARRASASTYLTAPRPMGLPVVAPPEPEPGACDGGPRLSPGSLMNYILTRIAEEDAAMETIFYRQEAGDRSEESMIELQAHMSKRQTAMQLLVNLTGMLPNAGSGPAPCAGAMPSVEMPVEWAPSGRDSGQ